MPKIKIAGDTEYPRPYWPKELKEEGYVGELDMIPNACTIVIPKPGTKNRDIARSLQILAEDFLHRADMSGEQGEGDD